jgi:hypothetical protein
MIRRNAGAGRSIAVADLVHGPFGMVPLSRRTSSFNLSTFRESGHADQNKPMKVRPPFTVQEIGGIGASAIHPRTPRLAVVICFVLAGAVVALDLIVSSRFGLLAYPPNNDGVTYMAGAKLLYYTVVHSIGEPSALKALAFNWPLLHAPLWFALMSATSLSSVKANGKATWSGSGQSFCCFS